MTGRDCAALGDLRSAYLDGALNDADRERVLTHLVGCVGCRADMEELRTVRRLLHRMGTTGAAPTSYELSSRLVSIAGGDAYVPVWSRPFRRTRPGTLPSTRRATRVRTAAAALAVGGLVSALGAMGYAAAPTVGATVSDPTDRVRSEFVATLAQFPLASRSLSALMMEPTSGLVTSTAALAHVGPSYGTGTPLTSQQAFGALQGAATESGQVSYSGTQVVRVVQGRQVVSAAVGISFETGQGSSVTVPRQGAGAMLRFVPATSSSRIVNEELLDLLTRGYSLSGSTGSTVVGRPVTVVEATPIAGTSTHVAARWWVDNATGLLLWQETYDANGAVAVASGFTSLRLSTQPVFIPHLPPRLATSTTTASLTLSSVSDLTTQGWYCQGQLAGLSLVRLRSDEATDPDALHMVYSDGVATLSVFEQRGTLGEPPAGSRLDESLHVYVRDGTPTMATWRSGDRVFTVMTDGSPDLLRAAVAALPHQVVEAPTTMDRIRAGWGHIIERVVG